MGKSLTTNPCRQIQMCDWIINRNETCLDLPSGACRQRTFLSPAGANSRNWNVKPALSRWQRQKTVQAATVNKSLQFRRRRRDFFAPVWGQPLVAMYVPFRDKIRSEGFAVAANISRRSGGTLKGEKPLLTNSGWKVIVKFMIINPNYQLFMRRGLSPSTVFVNQYSYPMTAEIRSTTE